MNVVHGIGPNGQVKGTVLVIEDGQSMGLSLPTILSRFRVAVIKAVRSDEAVSILRNTHFDAALLNINKTGIRETDICRRLHEHFPRLPIVVLGDSNDEDQVLEAFAASADDYIVKPFRHRELIARLDAAIRRGRLCTRYSAVITVGDISLDFSRHLAKKITHFRLWGFVVSNRRLTPRGKTSRPVGSIPTATSWRRSKWGRRSLCWCRALRVVGRV